MHRIPLTILCAAALAAADGAPPALGGPPPEGKRGPMPPAADLLKQADTDGDGKVTLAEFTAAHEKRRLEERTKQFELMDADKDGNVSKAEFLAFEPAPPAGPPGQQGPGGPPGLGGPPPGQAGPPGQGPQRPLRPDPAEMFKRLDRNGDGVLTPEDLQGRREDRQERREERREERKEGKPEHGNGRKD